MMTESICSK